MKKFPLITFILSISILSGCTTAMYSGPSTVDASKNSYEFFIATGGFSSTGTADERATQEINKFMSAKGFRTYKIVQRTDKFIPSGFDYIVEFSK